MNKSVFGLAAMYRPRSRRVNPAINDAQRIYNEHVKPLEETIAVLLDAAKKSLLLAKGYDMNVLGVSSALKNAIAMAEEAFPENEDHLMAKDLNLLPCPACGGVAGYKMCPHGMTAHCLECGMSGPHGDNAKNCIHAWNSLPRRQILIPADEWDEADGEVLWWSLPVEEPPWLGCMSDEDWHEGYTHWTPILNPVEPK